jgi:two-component system, LuxR family, sensor kinase FixL
MNWITIVCSMNAAACLTLAGIYALVWCKQRDGWAYLALSCNAVAGAALTAFELALLHARTGEQYAVILRWAQLPVWLLVVSLVVFVRLYLHGGRQWLAWSICGARTLALILNFIFTPNLSYRQITGLRQVVWWGGETVSVPVGVTNPWILVAQLSLLLLVIFFVDATITAWRRGDRRRALVVGGALILFSAIAIGQVVLVVWGIIQAPFLACFSYLGLITAMGYQMSNDMLQGAQLARQLQASEADLRETKQRMELAASAAELGMWMWDIVRNEIWITDKGRPLFGFTPSEKLDFDRFRSRVHPEDRESVLKAVEISLRTGAEYRSEYRVVLPDGQLRWIAGRGHVEFNGDGKAVRMRGASLDITKRKQAEEQFRLVVEAAPSAMIMVNTEGRITLVNTQAEAVFGYAREELIGHPIEMLVPERFRSHHMSDRRSYLRDAQARPMGAGRELFGRRKDGSQVPVEIGLNPIHTPEGLFVLASIIDISERKQAELEAARQRNELAHLSRVTMLGELSGSIAHELNLPLSAILSNAQTAQRILANGGTDLAELREILDEIVSEDKRAAEVIRRLRLWLKKGEVQQHLIRINNVVQDVLKLMRNDLIDQHVAVDTELGRHLPSINGDPIQLQQVLLNLVVNACDAMTSCKTLERRLLIRTGIENGSRAVIVSVTDRGSSVPEEKLEKIFEPFFTTKSKGLGLGLSVCRSLVTAHRGKLWATNNAQRGATFHFTLPVAAANKGAGMNNISQLTSKQCRSHGAVRRPGGVDPNGMNAPQARGYNGTEQS